MMAATGAKKKMGRAQGCLNAAEGMSGMKNKQT